MQIAVIVTAEASSADLTRCLRSLKTQLFPAAEVTVIACRDSDEKRALVAHWQRTYPGNVRTIVSPVATIGAACNLAIASSRCAHCVFLDARSELMPMTLEYYDRQFSARPAADVLYGRAIIRTREGRFLCPNEGRLPEGDVHAELFQGRLQLALSTVAVRRSVFDAGLRFVADDSLEPHRFLMALASRHRFAGVQEDVAIVGESQMTPPRRISDEWQKLLAEHAALLADRLGNESVGAVLAQSQCDAADIEIEAGRTGAAIDRVRHAFALSPRSIRVWWLWGKLVANGTWRRAPVSKAIRRTG